jgi:hypothetical protein
MFEKEDYENKYDRQLEEGIKILNTYKEKGYEGTIESIKQEKEAKKQKLLETTTESK